jgi:hypothetical protein
MHTGVGEGGQGKIFWDHFKYKKTINREKYVTEISSLHTTKVIFFLASLRDLSAPAGIDMSTEKNTT